jgi:hypothetical protein
MAFQNDHILMASDTPASRSNFVEPVSAQPQAGPVSDSKLAYVHSIKIFHQSSVERFADLDDNDDVIATNRRVVDMMPDGHPNKPMYFNKLLKMPLRQSVVPST